ncbi:HAMP domain-containing methyl-accepting chemotaxis protein [Anaerospora sp.]|jgi:methyl-accepting chemotaxis protein|uniref:HAMP domain-containing methyl-accepting chemotaxis protein n=1 Tax=Anaerospora sp. TaxID=1960278 RepID=UPI00289A7609|nr:HAMP domain-containing methyl-accepting chemotaxis protein [Anaerospora sp.]MDF2928941.1 methyl-accepting chemotaxis sensory transducer [Anaerospora sp.]
MKWTVAKKIGSGFLVVLTLVIMMSGFTYWKIGEITSSYQVFSKINIYKMEMVQGIAADIANEAVVMRRFNFTGDPSDISVYNSYKEKANEKMAWLEKNVSTETVKEHLRAIKNEKAAYEEIAEKSIAAKQANKLDEVASYMQQAGKPYKAAMSATEDLVRLNEAYAAQEQEKYAEDAANSRLMLVIVNIIVILLSILIAYFVSRSISRPVREVAEAASQIANGDLTMQSISYQSEDEIGKLANSFNTMLLNLRMIIQQVSVSAEQVAASSEELTASAEQSALAATQVAGTITEVAQGTDQQRQSISDTLQIIDTMTAQVRQIAFNADSTTTVSKQTAAAAQKGGEAIEAAIKQMTTIDQTVAESSAVISALGERSKEIGQIVNTIAAIAGQTNLLALNAAIEAARAGEQGRGFAVVAEEVRKLAEQSQTATKQIASLIHEIQAETNKAIIAMNAGTREVTTGTQVVNTAGRSFQDISALVGKMAGQIQDITASVQVVVASSAQIATSISEVGEVSRVTSGQTQTVSAATEEQSASMQEIAAASEALADMAADLQVTITKFTL